jgi:hypothetical protein
MNSAGLPGTGLGGLFYLLLAFWMPFAELSRTVRGRSSRARWRDVAEQFAMACGIVAAVVLTMVAYLRVTGVPSAFGQWGPALVLAPAVLAGVVLSLLVLVLRVWAGWQRLRARG